MNTDRMPCTLAILTHNSAATLPRALESAHGFADIIICDGGSTDETIAIARAYGARVIEQDSAFLHPDGRIRDFSGVRNQTLKAATQPWFFFLDSDEYLSPVLYDQLRRIAVAGDKGAYQVIRRYVVEGIEITCAASYPNRSMRFFARASADRFIKTIHERICLKEGVVPGELPGPLLVPVNTDMERAKRKRRHYIALQVEQERDVSWSEVWHITWHTLAVSLLYFYRAVRCRFVASGACLPWYLEFDTQTYNYELIAALWRSRLSMLKWRTS